MVLAGRVNAGKSTLFNRIAAGARAITSSIPGTTRDLNFARTSYDDRDFILIDSGGLELGGRERMSERIVREALAADRHGGPCRDAVRRARRLHRCRPGSARADSRHRMPAYRRGQQDRSARDRRPRRRNSMPPARKRFSSCPRRMETASASCSKKSPRGFRRRKPKSPSAPI